MRWLLCAGMAAALAGCSAEGLSGLGAATDPATTGAVGQGLTGAAEADPVSQGKKQFALGNFGNAEASFRKAAELTPHDAEAWIGLAASYDRLKRFDLADRAYAQTIRLVGRTPTVLNNQGYSYMLRGDFKTAAKLLNEAKRKDPDNPNVAANLDLLQASQKLAKDIR